MEQITQSDLLRNINYNLLSYKNLLLATCKDKILYLEVYSRAKALIGNAKEIKEIYGIVNKATETKATLILSLTSIIDENKNNTISVVIVKANVKNFDSYEKIEKERLLKLTNIRRKINEKLNYSFISTSKTNIFCFSFGSLKSIRKNCKNTKTFDTLCSLRSKNIIRYQMKFLVNVIYVYEMKAFYNSPINIKLWAKLRIDDGTYQGVAIVEDNILIHLFNLSAKFVDSVKSYTKKIKKNVILHDNYLNYSYEGVEKYIQSAEIRNVIIFGVPYSNCNYKIKKNNILRRFTYDDSKQQQKDMSVFINGDILTEKNEITKEKEFVLTPYISITEIESIE